VRTNIEIDDALMEQAQKASGNRNKKQTVEQALRLMVRLRGQQEVDAAFGRYRWRGSLVRSRKGWGTGDRWCINNRGPLLRNDGDFRPMARYLGRIEVPRLVRERRHD
jgi:Arc/MetJ family transcription regulator